MSDAHRDVTLVGALLLLLMGVVLSVAFGLVPVRRLCSPADALYWSSLLQAFRLHGIDHFVKVVKDWALRELFTDGQRSLAITQHHLPSDAALDVALGSDELRATLEACTTGIYRFEGPLNDGILPAASCAILECLHLQACRALAAGATGEAVKHFFYADAARSARSGSMPDDATAALLVLLRGDAAARLVILEKIPCLDSPALARLTRGAFADIMGLKDKDPTVAGLLSGLAKALSVTGSSCTNIPDGICEATTCMSSNCGQVSPEVAQVKYRQY